jgi:hypothetical protein
MDAKDRARLELMAKRMVVEVQTGRISDDWTQEFICNVYNRLDAGLSLSDKQAAKLEEIFERY